MARRGGGDAVRRAQHHSLRRLKRAKQSVKGEAKPGLVCSTAKKKKSRTQSAKEQNTNEANTGRQAGKNVLFIFLCARRQGANFASAVKGLFAWHLSNTGRLARRSSCGDVRWLWPWFVGYSLLRRREREREREKMRSKSMYVCCFHWKSSSLELRAGGRSESH